MGDNGFHPGVAPGDPRGYRGGSAVVPEWVAAGSETTGVSVLATGCPPIKRRKMTNRAVGVRIYNSSLTSQRPIKTPYPNPRQEAQSSKDG